jgi:hypothetical protein
MLSILVNPFFVPYPSSFIQTEKLSSATLWSWTKHLTTNLGFVAQKFTVKRRLALLGLLGSQTSPKLIKHSYAASCQYDRFSILSAF